MKKTTTTLEVDRDILIKWPEKYKPLPPGYSVWWICGLELMHAKEKGIK